MDDWRNRAACRDADPELFFSVANGGAAKKTNDEAKKYCRRCPVQAECLEDALARGMNDNDGVFGGMTADERRNERGRRNAAAGTPRQGRTTVQQHQVDEVLRLMEDGHLAQFVADETLLDRPTCLRVWREHRSTRFPPGYAAAKNSKPKSVDQPRMTRGAA